jgi:hypothetical protein
MGIPARPARNLHEGPAGSCIINGRALGWTNCTPAAFGDGVSRTTLQRSDPTACSIRRLTGDTTGGTTIPQNAGAIRAEYGIATEVRGGSGVCSPNYVAAKMRAGCGVVVQGNAGVLVGARGLDGTSLRSTKGNVNHAVWWNEGRGWHLVGSVWIPEEVLVYDPAADGRTAGWGKAADGPDWWPWAICLKFLAALRPWGDTDPRVLGPGKAYAAIFPDTEPHVHLHYAGSVRTNPFPRTMTVTVSPTANMRSGPSRNYPVKGTIPHGGHFIAYQQNPKGQVYAGSRLWYGDHNGKLWVHSSRLK